MIETPTAVDWPQLLKGLIFSPVEWLQKNLSLRLYPQGIKFADMPHGIAAIGKAHVLSLEEGNLLWSNNLNRKGFM